MWHDGQRAGDWRTVSGQSQQIKHLSGVVPIILLNILKISKNNMGSFSTNSDLGRHKMLLRLMLPFRSHFM